jgi:uncharacterized protein YaaR (DUF327 family)
MMKVGEASGQMPELPGERRKVRGKDGSGAARPVSGGGKAEAPAFGEALMDASRGTVVRALDQILEELSRQGEKLAAAQNFDELEKYKALVQEFLKKITQGVGRLHFSDGGSNGQAARVHVILKKVDLELDALTREVLARQNTPLKLLERLDQIRGLLLDLYK